MRRNALKYLHHAANWRGHATWLRAENLVEFSARLSKNVEAVNLLAEAGAIIAAEIDRLNNLKQE